MKTIENIIDPDELEYWSKKLGCHKETMTLVCITKNITPREAYFLIRDKLPPTGGTPLSIPGE